MIVILMGPTGSGKTTVGQALARRLGVGFADADDYHGPQNISKMRQGLPLSDDDRAGWLVAVASEITAQAARGESVVWACSALKAGYRRRLRAAAPHVTFVYLSAPEALLRKRLQRRKGHFADERLLASQLATLEPPRDAIVVDATPSVDAVVAEITRRLVPGTPGRASDPEL
jgi:gluconokinase